MLVLTRRIGEQIQIGEHVVVTVVKLAGGGVRLGIQAPSEMTIMRGEVAAAEADADSIQLPPSPSVDQGTYVPRS